MECTGSIKGSLSHGHVKQSTEEECVEEVVNYGVGKYPKCKIWLPKRLLTKITIAEIW